jgi:hypothetical protein
VKNQKKIVQHWARFKDRANITVRVPEQWPAHGLIADLLRASEKNWAP